MFKTIFEKIEEEGISVPQELKYSQYLATLEPTLNFEVYYPSDGTNLPEKREKLEYAAEHQLLSISVVSNVPGYEDRGREQALQTVTAFVDHLEKIAEKNRQESQQVGTATLYSIPKPHRRNLGTRISTTSFTSEPTV